MRIVFGLFLWILTATYCFGATNFWLGTAGDGLWSNPTNWSTGEIPAYEDHVRIEVAGTYTVTLDGDVFAATVTVGGQTGEQTLRVNDSLQAKSLLIGVNGTIIPAGASTIWAAVTNYVMLQVRTDVPVFRAGIWN